MPITKKFFASYLVFVSSFLIVDTAAAAFANVVCVTTTAELQSALTSARTSTLATLIEVSQGTYLVDSTLYYTATNGAGALTIEGGYTGSLLHGLCTAQIPNPALTVLDGQQSQSILGLNGGNGQSITVKYLTFQHGLSDDANPAGLFVSAFGAGSSLDIENNVFTGNTLLSQYSAVVAVLDAAASTVLNNVVVNNTLLSATGLDVATNATNTINANNNTLSGNSCATTSAAPGHGVYLFSQGNVSAFNNIFYGNSGCTDDLELNGTAATNFDIEFDDLGVGSYPAPGHFNSFSLANSIFIDPDFVTNGSFQLSATSPLVDAGSNSAPGGVGSIDAAGHPRIVSSRSATATVDIGAYEVQDIIFEDGFE